MFSHPPQRLKTQQRRKIKTPLHLKDSVTDTAVTDRLVYNHSKCYVVPSTKTDQYKHSFFVEPVLDWNHLDGNVAESGSVEDFRSNLSLQLGLVCDTFSLSSVAFMPFLDPATYSFNPVIQIRKTQVIDWLLLLEPS